MIIQELKELGLTQAMIAREMKVARQNVNCWFTGVNSPTARTISRLATAMSALTGKTIAPADVYTLITSIVEKRKKEK